MAESLAAAPELEVFKLESRRGYVRLAACGYDDLARRFLEAGACGYLAEPYRTAELGKRLRSALDQ